MFSRTGYAGVPSAEVVLGNSLGEGSGVTPVDLERRVTLVQTEYCKVMFSREERAELALTLARANQQLQELESRKKQVAAAIKSEIEEQAATIQRLARLVHDGYEFKDVEVGVAYDLPLRGQKTIYRKDTGEEVKVVAMNDADRQESLKFEESK